MYDELCELKKNLACVFMTSITTLFFFQKLNFKCYCVFVLVIFLAIYTKTRELPVGYFTELSTLIRPPAISWRTSYSYIILGYMLFNCIVLLFKVKSACSLTLCALAPTMIEAFTFWQPKSQNYHFFISAHYISNWKTNYQNVHGPVSHIENVFRKIAIANIIQLLIYHYFLLYMGILRLISMNLFCPMYCTWNINPLSIIFFVTAVFKLWNYVWLNMIFRLHLRFLFKGE